MSREPGAIQGNWTVDVKDIQTGSNRLARGAMALAHEGAHDVDSGKSGLAVKLPGVITRETDAYGVQEVVGRSLGLSFELGAFDTVIAGSVKNWLDRLKEGPKK